MPKKGNLVKVARGAGVSPSTVSRLVSGSARVSAEVAAKIRGAAEELGINFYDARKSNLIGFLLSNRDKLHRFHSHVLAGAESYCRSRRWSLLFAAMQYPFDTPLSQIPLPPFLSRRGMVSGVVVEGVNSQPLLELLRDMDIPFAVLGNNMIGPWPAEQCDVVEIDDEGGAHEMTRYLQSLGHHDVWYVGNTHLPWYARRYNGYARAMRENGLSPRKSGSDSDNDQEIGYLGTKTLLGTREPVSAIFAGTDRTVEGVYNALRDCGLSVPQDISVAGFNDLEASILHPPLTTVRVFAELVGSHMVQLVLKRIESPHLAPQHLTIPTQLVKRESCRAFPREQILAAAEPLGSAGGAPNG